MGEARKISLAILYKTRLVLRKTPSPYKPSSGSDILIVYAADGQELRYNYSLSKKGEIIVLKKPYEIWSNLKPGRTKDLAVVPTRIFKKIFEAYEPSPFKSGQLEMLLKKEGDKFSSELKSVGIKVAEKDLQFRMLPY
ncbi:MAG: hypothetical protein AABW88_03540 [Nanoarchaeota archaeon]